MHPMQLLHHLSLGNKIVVWDSLVISINMGGPLAQEGAGSSRALIYTKYTVQIKAAGAGQQSRQ